MKTYKSNIPEFGLKLKKTGFKKVKITCSEEACKYVRKFYSNDIDIFESMFCLFLNASNNTIGYVKISQGGTVGTIIDIKLIAKYAISSLCESIILVHNHPSSDLKPSNSDIELTKRTKEALNLLSIRIHDHLILTNESYFSFADSNII